MWWNALITLEFAGIYRVLAKSCCSPLSPAFIFPATATYPHYPPEASCCILYSNKPMLLDCMVSFDVMAWLIWPTWWTTMRASCAYHRPELLYILPLIIYWFVNYSLLLCLLLHAIVYLFPEGFKNMICCPYNPFHDNQLWLVLLALL